VLNGVTYVDIRSFAGL